MKDFTKDPFADMEGNEDYCPLEMKQIIELIKEKHPKAKEYSTCSFIQSTMDVRNIAKKNEKYIKDTTIRIFPGEDDVDEQYDNDSYILEKEGLFGVACNFPFMETSSMIFLFYDDVEIVKKAVFNEKSIYDVGNYIIKKVSGGFILDKTDLNVEDEPILNDDLDQRIVNDVKKFFEKEDFYRENNLTFKRGIMLYGPPGNGKTTLIRSILNNIGFAYKIIINDPSDFSSSISKFLEMSLKKDSKKILVFEDIDNVEKYERSALLNFLDGVHALNNTFVIATTNNLHELDQALVGRPSRFDRMYFVDLPSAEVREKLLLKFFPDLNEEDLAHCIKESNRFSGAYFKEIFIMSNLNDCSPLDAIKAIKAQKKDFEDYDEKEQSYMG